MPSDQAQYTQCLLSSSILRGSGNVAVHGVALRAWVGTPERRLDVPTQKATVHPRRRRR